MKFATAVSVACLLVGFGGAASAKPTTPASVTQRVSNAIWEFQQKNYEVAFAQFKTIAAETDNANAETMLGISYQYGMGAPKDYAQAAAWYQKAAEQGEAEAQVRLGLLYFNGAGVTKNKVEAYRLLSLGIDRVNAEPKAFRDNAQQALDDVSGALSLEQINKANVLARQTRYRTAAGPQS